MAQLSVLMSSYNAEKTILDAVNSILVQSFGDFEFIIIDDGSVDKTPYILEELSDSRIRLFIEKTNMGLTHRLNQGIQYATSNVIVRMDADDVSVSTRLNDQFKFFSQTKSAVVTTHAYLMNERGETVGTVNPIVPDESALFNLLSNPSPYIHSSAMFDKKIVEGIGGYDESLRTRQDLDLWIRLLYQNYKIQILPKQLVKFRIHDNSISSAGLENWKLNVVVVARQILIEKGKVMTIQDLMDVSERVGGVKRYARSIRCRRNVRKLKASRNLTNRLYYLAQILAGIDVLIHPEPFSKARDALLGYIDQTKKV